MKIGILTFCNGYNYGAMLQCYALQEYLNKNGIEAEVINFKKEKKYSKTGINFLSPSYMLRKTYSFLYKLQIETKHREFNKFFKDKVKHYPSCSLNEKTINAEIKKYDIILFGSDQIWNMDEKIYDRSKIFFGEFDFSGKKISYAASFGDSISVAVNNIEYIKKMLRKFDSITVREKTAVEFLKKINIDSSMVCDPTLLLTSDDWNKIIEKPNNKKIPSKYILYYSVNCRKYSWKIAKKIAKKTGLKVINLEEHPKIIGSGFMNDYMEGPAQFLYLIKNAEYVVTNSFHGTIFSIIFKRNLIPVFEQKNGEIVKEERKYSILEAAGLLEMVTTESSSLKLNYYNKQVYSKIEKNIKKLTEVSKDFLKKSCGEKK